MSKDSKDNSNQLIPLIDQRIDSITTPRFEQLLVEIRANREIMDSRFEAMQKQMDIRFAQSDKRFEQMQQNMDKRFEQMQHNMDKRFEQMQKQMDMRFNQVDKRFDQFLTFYRWQFGIIFFGFLGLYLKLFFNF